MEEGNVAENGTIIVNHTGFFSCFDSVPRVGIAPLLTRILQRKGKKNPLFSFLNCPAIFPKLTIIFSLTFFFFVAFVTIALCRVRVCRFASVHASISAWKNAPISTHVNHISSLIRWLIRVGSFNFEKKKRGGKKETDVSGHVDS